MARRRIQHNDDDGGGLDSLLDTMTNVVGILVLVLIATQLGVQQAVTKAVTDVDKLVSTEDLEKKRKELAISLEEKEMILAQLENRDEEDLETVEVRVAELRRKAKERKQELEKEKQIANTFAEKIESDTKLADEAKKEIASIEDSLANREKMQMEIAKALEQEAKIKALLDDTPVQKAPPPKIVSLPDPKPAPEGAKRLTFVCVYNRVYPIQEDVFRDSIKPQCEALCNGIVQNGVVDKEQFFARVAKVQKNWKDDDVTVEVVASGIYLNMRVVPKDIERAGASLRELENSRSKFRKAFASIDNRQFYAKFIVFPDSYDIYLTMRAIATKQRLLAGWEPRKIPPEGQPAYVDFPLRSKILFGERPPPKPADPNAPKPKPVNEID